MEVQHHPQVEKKNFKEYFLEFLMIFLAVTMGFFAESIRENISDGEHVKQLVRQLIQDLTKDRNMLKKIDSLETEVLAETDTLSHLLQEPAEKTDFKRIQDLTIASYSYFPFYPSLGAINAIKNELRIKQFSNSEIASKIDDYEWRMGVMIKIQDLKSDMIRNFIEPFFRLHFKPVNLDAALDHHPVPDGVIRNLSQNEMEQFSVDLVLIKNMNKDMISFNRQLRGQAQVLSEYAARQFHLENE
jgi:hypothetical protein